MILGETVRGRCEEDETVGIYKVVTMTFSLVDGRLLIMTKFPIPFRL